jgi:hypothetical protein
MSAINYQPFNVFKKPLGVFPPVARVKVNLPTGTDGYHLMTSREDGPKEINFWHAVCHPETVVNLSGSYEINLGGQLVQQKFGDVLVIPAYMPHGMVKTKTGYHNLQIENTHPRCQNPPQQIDAII